VLGIPIGTVKSRVSRGRQMMRTALGAFARRRALAR
jgi:DNA-directed RNA polymerase specialized sigma24 family protein